MSSAPEVKTAIARTFTRGLQSNQSRGGVATAPVTTDLALFPLQGINDRRAHVLGVNRREGLLVLLGCHSDRRVGPQVHVRAAGRPDHRLRRELVVDGIVLVERTLEGLFEARALGAGEKVLDVEVGAASGRHVVVAAIVDGEHRDRQALRHVDRNRDVAALAVERLVGRASRFDRIRIEQEAERLGIGAEGRRDAAAGATGAAIAGLAQRNIVGVCQRAEAAGKEKSGKCRKSFHLDVLELAPRRRSVGAPKLGHGA